MPLKEEDGIANSVDPDQTAPSGVALIRVYAVSPDLFVQKS